MKTTTLRHTTLRPIWVDTSGDADEVSWDGPAGTHDGTAVFLVQRLDGEERAKQYLTYRESMKDAIALAVTIDKRMEEIYDLMSTTVGLDWHDKWNLAREAAYDTLHALVREGNRRPRGDLSARSEREAL